MLGELRRVPSLPAGEESSRKKKPPSPRQERASWSDAALSQIVSRIGLIVMLVCCRPVGRGRRQRRRRVRRLKQPVILPKWRTNLHRHQQRAPSWTAKRSCGGSHFKSGEISTSPDCRIALVWTQGWNFSIDTEFLCVQFFRTQRQRQHELSKVAGDVVPAAIKAQEHICHDGRNP